QRYFNGPISDQTRHGFEAMKCASLLRETLWSMVSEIHSQLDFDFVDYTRENLERFDQQWNSFSV
ncbi:choline kinase, partial [Gammaproteobacteria bacterium]|nr:choline kinase [Gammaproteobacteria bacterium]